MPTLEETVPSAKARTHTFVGYGMWSGPHKFGEGTTLKETNPVWKYQTTGAIMLLGCTIFANVICIIKSNTWDTGNKPMDHIHNVGIKLEGIVVSLLAMAVEVEWVQMLQQVPILVSWHARGLLFGLLAALTFEENKEFEYYEYIEYTCAGLLTMGVIYFLAGTAVSVSNLCSKKDKFDDSL